MQEDQHDICFLGLKCRDHLLGKPTPTYLGGIERQLATLGRELTKAGWKVAFITFDEQAEVRTHDGITILPAYDPRAGVRLLRFLHPRMSSIWRAMKFANARCHVQMGRGVEVFVLGLGCRLLWGRKPRRFVFMTASDADCQAKLTTTKSHADRVLYKIGIRMADEIAAQTLQQQAMLHAEFGLPSTVLKLPYVPIKPASTAPKRGCSIAISKHRPNHAN